MLKTNYLENWVRQKNKGKKRNCNCYWWMYDAGKHIVDKLQKVIHFDIVFGTHTLHKFPQDLYNVILNKKRIEDIIDIDGEIIEGLPIKEMII